MQFEKKTVVLEEQVKVVKKTEERYCCPKCPFEHRSDDDLVKHYLDGHVLTKQFKWGDGTIIYFENEADAELFVDRQPYREYAGSSGEVCWIGPGWYHWTSNDYEERYPELVEIHKLLQDRITSAKTAVVWAEGGLLEVDEEIAKLS